MTASPVAGRARGPGPPARARRPGAHALPALGPAGPFTAHNQWAVPDVAGHEIAELSLVPSLFVKRSLAALRRAAPMPAPDRLALIAQAADLFQTATLGGLSPDGYALAVSRAGGTPITVVRRAVDALGERLRRIAESVEAARPAGTVAEWPLRGSSGAAPASQRPHAIAGGAAAVWRRRGEVFAVQAAGNHPGTHSVWPQALALGYRVAVRPSRREPFTAHRLVSALRAAGFPDDSIVLLPTGHELADTVLQAADLAMVYGGADVVARYAGCATILPQGPGRSKILLTRDVDWREHLDTLIASIGDHGGAGCVNTSAVFVEGDPAPLCEALADRLAALPSRPPEAPDAVLPVQSAAAARALGEYLARRAAGAREWLGAAGVVDELGDGSAALRPAVHQLDRAEAPQAAIELPFPCVWVAPWSPQDGTAPLRDSLVVTALTGNRDLVAALLDEPTIANVYVGDVPTYRMEPRLPHDGFLAEFLMRSKSVIHG